MAEIAALAAAHPDALRASVRSFDIGGRAFDADACIELMGVVNLSRDSWYRESVSPSTTAAIERGRVLAAQGAMIIDIGAESTIPGAARVSPADQVAGVLPVVTALRDDGIVTSVETYSPEVAKVVLGAGAWGCTFARVASLAGSRVTLACHTAEQAAVLRETRHDRIHLGEVVLPDDVHVTHVADPSALDGASVVVIAMPSRAVAEGRVWMERDGERMPWRWDPALMLDREIGDRGKVEEEKGRARFGVDPAPH
jgi:hypothetical protein